MAISIKQDVPIVPSQSTDNIQQHDDKEMKYKHGNNRRQKFNAFSGTKTYC